MLATADIEEIIRLHNEQVASGKALRNLRKRQVTRVVFNGTRYVVKAYLRRWWHRLFHLLPGDASSLSLLEGLTPPCVADTGASRPWQYTIYPDAGARNFYELIKLIPLPQDFEALYAHAGELLAKIHLRGVYHGDTKPPNFVINTNLPELPPVVIVDCDHIVTYRRIPVRRQVFNLAQFIATNNVPVENRALFLHCIEAFAGAYASTAGLSRELMGNMIARAVQLVGTSPRLEKRINDELLQSIKV